MERWYAGRVKYRTEQKIKDFLTEQGIRYYIPFEKVFVERRGKMVTRERPVIPSLIFVNTNYKMLTVIQKECKQTIIYVRNHVTRLIEPIPDKQMQDFMFVIDFSEQVFTLDATKLKIGERVRVKHGIFKGIEGELIRIKGHKRVVVRLEGMFAVASNTYIPIAYLERIS
jgi:transcription antitermination factor NusG